MWDDRRSPRAPHTGRSPRARHTPTRGGILSSPQSPTPGLLPNPVQNLLTTLRCSWGTPGQGRAMALWEDRAVSPPATNDDAATVAGEVGPITTPETDVPGPAEEV